MVDRQFADDELASLYDVFHPWETRHDYRFYLGRMGPDESVLDVGCGTGTLLHRARDSGHRGRLCGLDPAEGMLARARLRADVEWVRGEPTDAGFAREFDLIVMTGHAFQVLVTDAELRAALAGIERALADGGRFAFETRNPAARAWERWVPANGVEITAPDGAVVRMEHQVEPPESDLVAFTTTYTSPSWTAPELSTSTLRFLDTTRLGEFLAEAGLVATERYGDFAGGPLTPDSPEIITIARRA